MMEILKKYFWSSQRSPKVKAEEISDEMGKSMHAVRGKVANLSTWRCDLSIAANPALV